MTNLRYLKKLRLIIKWKKSIRVQSLFWLFHNHVFLVSTGKMFSLARTEHYTDLSGGQLGEIQRIGEENKDDSKNMREVWVSYVQTKEQPEDYYHHYWCTKEDCDGHKNT